MSLSQLSDKNEFFLYNSSLIANPRLIFNEVYLQRYGKLDQFNAGRSSITLIKQAPCIRQAIVLKQYHRGGLLAKLIESHYIFSTLGNTRSFQEAMMLQKLASLGAPVATPVAAKVTHKNLCYQAWLATLFVPQTQQLSQLTLNKALALNCGAQIRKLHDFDCIHTDLNATNILYNSEGKLTFIDFDKAYFSTSHKDKQNNLARLQHSLMKFHPKDTVLDFMEYLYLGYS